MLKQETLNYLQGEAKNYNIKKMMLFGSSVYKKEEEARDIDLAVEGISGWDLHKFHGKLMMTLNKNVDMVDLLDNTSIVPIVLEKGVVIYEQ